MVAYPTNERQRAGVRLSVAISHLLQLPMERLDACEVS
jgi:hypothetical protein